MNSRRVHQLVIGLLVLTVLGSGFAIFVANQRLSERSDAIAEIKAEQEVLDQKIVNFLKDKYFIENNQDLVQIIDQALPDNKSQADLVAEIKKFANESSLTLSAITFESSAQTTDPNKSQTQKIPDLPGVLYLEAAISIQPTDTTTYENLLKFLNKIENNLRLMQVTDISLVPNKDNRQLFSSVNLTVNAYVKE